MVKDTDELHDWFHAEWFRVDTEEYGEFDLMVVDRDLVEEDAYVNERHGGLKRHISLEGDPGDGTRVFNGIIKQGKRESTPTLSVAEMVNAGPYEYEELTLNEVEEIEDHE